VESNPPKKQDIEIQTSLVKLKYAMHLVLILSEVVTKTKFKELRLKP
jgi:hypothetical protein